MEMLDELTGVSAARWGPVLAGGLGLVVGSLGRGLPEVIAADVVSGDSTRDCGDEGVVECATRALPEVVAATAVYGLLVVALYTVATLCGAGLLAVGIRSGMHADVNPDSEGLPTTRFAGGLLMVALGTCLMMPALWAIASAIAGG